MRLILFRHGLTDANERHLYCGSTDLPLSERGVWELRAIRASGALPALSGMRIVTSPARRCRETLAELYGGLPFDAEPGLREMDFGKFEMRSYSDLKDDPDYIRWITGDNEANVCPGGESGEQMRARVLASLRLIIEDGRPTAIFTHGGPTAAIMSALFPSEHKNRYEWQPAPGRGYVIDTDKRGYWKI